MKRRLSKKDNKMKKILLYLTLPLLAFVAVLVSTGVLGSSRYFSKAESEEVKVSSSRKTTVSSTSKATKQSSSSKASSSSSSSTSSTSEATAEANPSVTEEEATVAATDETVAAAEQAPEATQVSYNYNAQATVYTPAQNTQQYVAPTGRALSNGNTAGETGSYAAAQMAAATGVDQSTWENIIARESNGQVNAQNASGASGLFQTMPGWGSTATVQDQINSAINAYNAQGLAAWGY